MREHYLYPGMLFAEQEPHRVTTVLGSCIAVCLYDPVSRIGGINHYMLPLWNGEGLPTPRYGNVAIDTLLDRLLGLGCPGSRLQAKLFGGAAMWENVNSLISVGDRNIDLARRMLDRYGIRVVASDLGGGFSRKIIFNTATGEVLLKRQLGSAHAGPRRSDEPVLAVAAGKSPAEATGLSLLTSQPQSAGALLAPGK